MINRKRVLLLALILILTSTIVYSPHLVTPFPLHADEWHHIEQALRLKNSEYKFGTQSVEIGFHIFLLIISYLTDLVLFYKFLPAIWAVLSSIILFAIILNKTSRFYIAILAIIFFASIKSNVNIMGLWFFTPLTFSIPFIFLYIYLFTEGIQKQNKKYILTSLVIMLFLIPVHSISVLFAIPFLAIYALIHYKYLLREYKFFLLFLLIPVIGIFFYSQIFNLTIVDSLAEIFQNLQFRQGWGVLELKNSFAEVYSLTGYLLAFLGLVFIIKNKTAEKYLEFILWPLTLLIMIFIFKTTGTSYFSPFQRNLYYLAISLPFLSAYGTYCLIAEIKNKIKNSKFVKLIIIFVLALIIILTFFSYLKTPEQIQLYKIIDNQDYQDLKFLSTLPKSKILAEPIISTAIYPVSQQNITADIFQRSSKQKDVEKFFETDNCTEKEKIIKTYKPDYVLSEYPIDCNYTEIYNKNNYVYNVKKLKWGKK